MNRSKLILSILLLTGIVITSVITKIIATPPDRFIVLKDINSLTFKDFQGAPPLLNDYAAAIATKIKVSKVEDSIYAETIFDRHQSWVYGISIQTKELLAHEKYHVHITDYGTNALNDLIRKKRLSFSEAIDARDSITYKMYWLHFDYDKQTRHSLYVENQIYWEYKIDSLNQVIKNNPNEEPNFGDAEVFFSSQPNREINIYPDMISSVSYTSKNNINLEIQTLYDLVYSSDPSDYENNIDDLSHKDIKIDSLNLDGNKALKFIATDSTDSIEIVDVLIPGNNRTYQISTSYPKKEIFRNISNNFINSFKIKDESKLWEKYYDKNINKEPWEITFENINDKEEILVFTKSDYSDYALIYSKPFEYDKKLLIPFKPVRHELKDIMQILAIVNEKIKISNEIDSLYQMIPIELSELKKGENHIQIGYIPKEKDTIEDLNHFYSTHIYYKK